MVLEAKALILAKQLGASFSPRDRTSRVLPPNENIKTPQLPLYKGPKCVNQARGGEKGMEAQGGFSPSLHPSSPHDPAHLTPLLQ